MSLAFSSLTKTFDSHNRISHFLSFSSSSSPYFPPSFKLVGKWKGCKEKNKSNFPSPEAKAPGLNT